MHEHVHNGGYFYWKAFDSRETDIVTSHYSPLARLCFTRMCMSSLLLVDNATLVGWTHYSLEPAHTSCSVEWSSRSLSATTSYTSYDMAIFVFVFFIPLAVIAIFNLHQHRPWRRNRLPPSVANGPWPTATYARKCSQTLNVLSFTWLVKSTPNACVS